MMLRSPRPDVDGELEDGGGHGTKGWHEYDDGEFGEEEGYDDAHEEDPNSRYVDYTCATSWEYFINDIEEVLRRWEGRASAPSSATVTSPPPTSALSNPPQSQYTTLTYNDHAYTLVRWHTPTPSFDGEPPPHPLEDGALDFDTRLPDIQRWFGLRDFIMMWKNRPPSRPVGEEAGMDRSEATLLLSALSVALHNCDLCLPALVPIGRRVPRPTSQDPFAGFAFLDDIIGYAPPSDKHQLGMITSSTILVPFTTRFETCKAFQPPEAYKTLEGFMELFTDKLSCSTPLASQPLASPSGFNFPTGHDEVLNTPTSPNGRQQLSISVQHTWQWETRQSEGLKEWRCLMSAPHLDLRAQAVRKVLTRMEEADGRLDPLWGPSYDPLRSLRLRVRWVDLTDGNVVENAFYSTLQPLQTRPGAWLIQAAYHKADPEEAAKSGIEVHGHHDAGASNQPSSTEHVPRYLETLVLSGIVKKLLAAYVASQAVKPGTLMTDLGRATSNEDSQQEEDAAAMTIASLLGPDMVQAVKAMQGQTRVPSLNPRMLAMVTFLLGGGGVDEEEDEDMKAIPPFGSRTLERWCDKMGSPIGGLVSLLALMMGTRESLWSMARLWAELVRELRWRWDQADGEEHHSGLVRLVGLGADPGNAPDLAACLVQQKLHVLDLCMRRRDGSGSANCVPLAPMPPPPSVATPGFASPIQSMQDKKEDDDFFFDTVGEETPTSRQREGALFPAQDGRLKSLKTGATIWIPACQEVCPVTEDGWLQQIQLLQRVEREEAHHHGPPATAPPLTLSLQERVRSQLQMAPLLADMQAFKAANPEGAVLADFVRWNYPEVWVDDTSDGPPDYDEESEEDDEVSLMWEGSGYVDSRLFALTHSDRAELARLWRRAEAVPALKQKPLFNLPQEAEKVLHYLETCSPSHLLCQMLSVGLVTAHFVLSQAPTEASSLNIIKENLSILEDLIKTALEQLHEEQLASDTLVLNRELSHAVSQSTLMACQKACQAITKVEDLLSRGASLLHKLPGQERLVDEVLHRGESLGVPLVGEKERQAVIHLFGEATVHPSEQDMWTRSADLSASAAAATVATASPFHLPPAGVRTYVLRSHAPTPYHHGYLGPAGLQHVLLSPPVTSRLYASVNKADDSVRLALALSEADY